MACLVALALDNTAATGSAADGKSNSISLRHLGSASAGVVPATSDNSCRPDDQRGRPEIAPLRPKQPGLGVSLDDAILKHAGPPIVGYDKVDEILFNFDRKRVSVVVRRADEYLLTKGEAESVFAICHTVAIDGVPQPMDDSRRAEAEATLKKLGADGHRAIRPSRRRAPQTS